MPRHDAAVHTNGRHRDRSPAERLYATARWTRVGAIPQYATDPAGVPQSTTIFYESLG